MAKYRKRQVVIEAECFGENGENLSKPFRNAVLENAERIPFIRTLEGPLYVSRGDWIICGIKGEFYACKPDIFAATYEPA